jgi:hypothetical protein
MGACDKENEGNKAMATAIRVVGDEEGEGNREGNGDDNEGGVQQKEQWIWWQERWQQGWRESDGVKGDGNCDGNNLGIGNGNKAGRQQRGRG